MEHQLEVKPAVIREGQKYVVIEITDVEHHTTKKSPLGSIGKKINRTLNDTPGRIYKMADQESVDDPKGYILRILGEDPDFLKFIKDQEVDGTKVLIAFPKDGVPAKYGKDTIEFLEGKNGKRVLRGLAKKNSKQ